MEECLIVDTRGRVTLFKLVIFPVALIKSLRYIQPAENKTIGYCPYIEFWFYDTNNKTTEFTIISPGQRQSPCVSFNESQVTAYSGAKVTEKIPEDLLEWVDEGSPQNS
jgi:hypothetical protein